MAVINTEAKRTESLGRITVTSIAAVAANDIELLNLGGGFQKWYVYVRMFDISDDQIVDSAGTATVTWQGPRGLSTLAATYEASSGTIDLTDGAYATITGPAENIKAVLASESDTVTWELIVVGFPN